MPGRRRANTRTNLASWMGQSDKVWSVFCLQDLPLSAVLVLRGFLLLMIKLRKSRKSLHVSFAMTASLYAFPQGFRQASGLLFLTGQLWGSREWSWLNLTRLQCKVYCLRLQARAVLLLMEKGCSLPLTMCKFGKDSLAAAGAEVGYLVKHVPFWMWFLAFSSSTTSFAKTLHKYACSCQEAQARVINYLLRGRFHGGTAFTDWGGGEEECSLSAPGHHTQTPQHFLKLLAWSSKTFGAFMLLAPAGPPSSPLEI